MRRNYKQASGADGPEARRWDLVKTKNGLRRILNRPETPIIGSSEKRVPTLSFVLSPRQLVYYGGLIAGSVWLFGIRFIGDRP
jgi:hypothetical protein